MGHFPVGNPFAAGPFLLFAHGSGTGLGHAAGYSGFRPHRNVGFHSSLPEGKITVFIRRIDGTANPVFVIAHVPVGHDNGFDIRIDEVGVPAIGIGDTVDIVPATGVETGKMASQCRPDFHQLECCLKLLYQHIGFDGSFGKAQMGFKGGKEPVPESGFFSCLDLGQIQDDGTT